MGVGNDIVSMGNNKCVYIGHAGEAQPMDIMGKNANYGVYFLSCPPPLFDMPLAQRRASPRQQCTQRCFSEFLAGPCRDATDLGIIAGEAVPKMVLVRQM